MLRQFCAVRHPISAETGIETARCVCRSGLLPKDSFTLRVIECSCLMRLWRSKQEYHTGETFPARLTLP